MDIINYINGDALIICPSSYKKRILMNILEQKNMYSIKFMTLKEFTNAIRFSYSKDAVFYVMNKLNFKYDIAVEYLESLFFLEDRDYKSNKLNNLNKLRIELDSKGLLKRNDLFSYYLRNTSIIVYGYELDFFYKEILDHYNVTYLVEEEKDRLLEVYEFRDIDDEISYICHDIKNKLDKGIDINNIKIIKPTNEYVAPLQRIFNWCHLPLDDISDISLFNIPVGKDILSMIDDGKNFSDILEQIQEEKINSSILRKIVNIFNQYSFEEQIYKLRSMIENDLRNTYLDKLKKDNSISFISLEEAIDTDYVYFLGFNKENVPVLHKDEDLLSDSMKEELGLFNSNKLNEISISDIKRKLKAVNNIFISYKLRTNFEVFNPSLLIEDKDFEVIRDNKIDYQLSNLFNKITLAKSYDNYDRYGTIDEELHILSSNYKNLDYLTYDNRFTGIKRDNFYKYIKNRLVLSYSSIDNYYRCGFRYYINNILKIDSISGKFYQNIGTIFHNVLARFYEEGFSFDLVFNEEVSKFSFSISESALLDKLKDELRYDLVILEKQKNYSRFNKYYLEKKIVIPLSNDYGIDSCFMGVVDKINYYEGNKTLVSIIDYKTGSLQANLNNVIYGIGMQLPIYSYLVKRSGLFSDMEIVGFYLQKVINKDIKVSKNKDYEELKENSLKLVGYSTDKEDILEQFDMTYYDSELINGLKRKKEGFYNYSKILSKKQMDNLDKLVDEKIRIASRDILEGKFDINPKRIDKEDIGCSYCTYRDICFKKEEDYVLLDKHQSLDFLGGEESA